MEEAHAQAEEEALEEGLPLAEAVTDLVQAEEDTDRHRHCPAEDTDRDRRRDTMAHLPDITGQVRAWAEAVDAHQHW